MSQPCNHTLDDHDEAAFERCLICELATLREALRKIATGAAGAWKKIAAEALERVKS